MSNSKVESMPVSEKKSSGERVKKTLKKPVRQAGKLLAEGKSIFLTSRQVTSLSESGHI
jgi:hypothetical protein